MIICNIFYVRKLYLVTNYIAKSSSYHWGKSFILNYMEFSLLTDNFLLLNNMHTLFLIRLRISDFSSLTVLKFILFPLIFFRVSSQCEFLFKNFPIYNLVLWSIIDIFRVSSPFLAFAYYAYDYKNKQNWSYRYNCNFPSRHLIIIILLLERVYTMLHRILHGN